MGHILSRNVPSQEPGPIQRDVVNLLSRLQKLQPTDPYITRQLALATYRSEYPDKLAALIKAQLVLETLRPDTSSDAETVGIWGRVHKGLWEVTKNSDYLDKAIRSFARGYFMKDDFFNGIKFAFLLNVRSTLLMGDEAIADRVLASRIRTEVLALCEKALAGIAAGQDQWLPTKQRPNIKFWVEATKAEALLGLGRVEEAAALRRESLGATPSGARWMVKDVHSQLDDLAALCGLTAWVSSGPKGSDEGRQVQE